MEQFNKALAALLGTPYAEAAAEPPPPPRVTRVDPEVLKKFAQDVRREDAGNRDAVDAEGAARAGNLRRADRVDQRDAAFREYFRDQLDARGREMLPPIYEQEADMGGFGTQFRPYTANDLSMEQASVLKDMLLRRQRSLEMGEGLAGRMNRLQAPDMRMPMPNARALPVPRPPSTDPDGYVLTPNEHAMIELWRNSVPDMGFPYSTFTPARSGRRT